ncbi:MAG: heavy metal translocating P-type ATPase [Phycisphaerae bacterium]
MLSRPIISPTRRVFNPILVDDPLADIEAGGGSLFYTASSQWIEKHLELIIAVAAGVCLLAAWLVRAAGASASLRDLFILLTFCIAGVPALQEVWGKLQRLRIDVDLLMLLGAGLAAYVGSPYEGALLLFLFALSGGLESYALGRTQAAIVALRSLAPTEATVIAGDAASRMPIRRVQVGMLVLVRPGESIPVDGMVVEGASSVDQSAITGESIPRNCSAGDSVFAGTQNLDGRLEIRVTRLAEETTLAKVVKMVTEARHRPATAQRLIDRVGPTYSGIVIAGSCMVPLIMMLVFDVARAEAIRRGIALLIVASPCALIIATPVAYLSAIAGAARRGVLIKGGVHLEVVARSTAVAFDKTGTLTTGKVALTNIEIDGAIDEDEALRLAGAVERSSTHPLAAAVNESLERRGLSIPPATEYRATPGEGEAGTIQGRSVWIGRLEMLSDCSRQVSQSIRERAEQLRREGKTVSALVVDDAVGLLAFQDTIRDGAGDCIAQLHRQGIKRIEMLTGDHELVAKRVARTIGMDAYRAELAPHEKVAVVAELAAQYGVLIAVGDGINDAPLLARADVGIAMGGMGADVALEAADVVLMKDRLESVAWLHRHAKKTADIVRQNLTLAIGVIAALSVVAVTGSIPLPLAVIGHEGSTVAVALNALRLLRATPGGVDIQKGTAIS